ncbi:Hsp70 family protein [Aneurinibacillus danicus]|jgi:molecular chaperone DnaK (HSP70)|uniref:Uncharacterized protein n=1 Tax=Aneurinibacillus danicus TaxID=267746 RepID=A0A511VCE2_9BACL|nr:Hsp70 family protein [Aneurinibacillus danicus]GEN35598.1 hypothetical protein ADA01nite_30580 [Aneurinibacillus danicus]
MRIPRNTTIPVTRTERFHTVYPGQTAVSIEIYQGEHERVKYNHSLREFLLEGIPAIHEKAEKIDVMFRFWEGKFDPKKSLFFSNMYGYGPGCRDRLA